MSLVYSLLLSIQYIFIYTILLKIYTHAIGISVIGRRSWKLILWLLHVRVQILVHVLMCGWSWLYVCYWLDILPFL